MNITVTTGSWAARYMDGDAAVLDMPEDSTPADVISALGLPLDEAGIVSINGKAVPRGHRLSDGDCLKIYPVIIGG